MDENLSIPIPSNIHLLNEQIQNECKRILDNTIIVDDTMSERLDKHVGSDIARARPQDDNKHDDSHLHHADSGIQDVLLLPTNYHQHLDTILINKLATK